MTSAQALEELRLHPLCISPAIEALRSAADLDDPALPELCARLAATLPSRQALEDMLGDRAEIMANFYPVPEEPTPSTLDTIDTFLATFGTPDPRETEALNKLIFNPVPDYSAQLAAQEEAAPSIGQPASEQDRLISAFLDKAPAAPSEPAAAPARKPMPPLEPEPLYDLEKAEAELKAESDKLTNEKKAPAESAPRADSGTLTESFVRVLIKNRNYAKALEIISEINLKNPEKSIYFADQIRFLKKLIINERKK